jgi:beta-fructofuranosidase
MKNNKIKELENRILKTIWFLSLCILGGCKSNKQNEIPNPNPKDSVVAFSCSTPYEQTDYSIYPLSSDAVRVADLMPYFDSESSSFNIYYLKDIWNDAVNRRHPWYCLKTDDFFNYSTLSLGEVLSCSTNPCAQDYALGTGSIIKKASTYFAFYTGHNPNSPSSCITTKEGIMLATTSSLGSAFLKNTSFNTIYAPDGYDKSDNFRDPYVYYDIVNSKYYLILSARKQVNGIWKGVIPYYTSTDLNKWEYQGVLYDGGTSNFFMMETPEIFKMGNYFYLLFSDYDSKNVFYRKSTSITGEWSLPATVERFEGNGIYAAKTAANEKGERYIFGWTYVQEGNSDNGKKLFGGNLVTHRIYAKQNGDLVVAIPPTLKSYLETATQKVNKVAQRGNVVETSTDLHSYKLGSAGGVNFSSVVFEPINLPRFKINTKVTFTSPSKDFGFMIGACNDYNDFYSLRFVPADNKLRLDKVSRSNINNSMSSFAEVPLVLKPNTNYEVQIVIENSMLVVYVNDEVALSTRVYKATNTNWGVFTDSSEAKFDNIVVYKQ